MEISLCYLTLAVNDIGPNFMEIHILKLSASADSGEQTAACCCDDVPPQCIAGFEVYFQGH